MRSRLPLFTFVTLFLLVVAESCALSQDTDLKPRERLRLVDEADSLVINTIGGQDIWEIWGHVHLAQGDAQLLCDRASWWQNDDRVILKGNVMIYDGKRTLLADRVDYDGKTRMERSSGNVSLQSGEKKLVARRLNYSRDKELASAYGDITITDLVERASIKGYEAIFDRALDYGMIQGNPQLTMEDTTSGENMVVHGVKIEAWGEDQRVVVTDSVRIEKGELRAVCQMAEYRANDDLLVLERTPTVWHRDQEMIGNRIDIQLDDLQFRGGVIQGEAEIISRDSTYEDLLKGQRITVEVDQDTIRKVVVDGQASSFYHIFEEGENERIEQGVNSVTGDRIILTFEGGRLERVKVESDPGQCMGTFTPKEEEGKIKEKGQNR